MPARRKPSKTIQETFPAHYESLEIVGEFITTAIHEAHLDELSKYGILLAVDEAFSNIVEHAYRSTNTGFVDISCQIDSRQLVIQFHDHGIPFDPSSVQEPDLNSDLEERRPGGLGLFLIRQFMDDVQFEIVAPPGKKGKVPGNYLTLIKYVNPVLKLNTGLQA